MTSMPVNTSPLWRNSMSLKGGLSARFLMMATVPGKAGRKRWKILWPSMPEAPRTTILVGIGGDFLAGPGNVFGEACIQADRGAETKRIAGSGDIGETVPNIAG